MNLHQITKGRGLIDMASLSLLTGTEDGEPKRQKLLLFVLVSCVFKDSRLLCREADQHDGTNQNPILKHRVNTEWL